MRNKIKEKKQSMKQQKQKIKAKFPDSFREDENEEDETLRQENQPALVENPLVVPALVEPALVETPLVDQVIPIQLNLDVPLMVSKFQFFIHKLKLVGSFFFETYFVFCMLYYMSFDSKLKAILEF